jgi:hypothetical protein
MKLSYLDSFIISTGPMLMAYKFFFPGISPVDFLMILSILLHGLKGSLWKIQKLPIVFFIFGIILIHLMFMSVEGVQETLGYYRLFKYLIIISFITVAYSFINIDMLAKFLAVVVLINVLAILLQYALFYLVDIKTTLIVPFLSLANDHVTNEKLIKVLVNDFRPGGLFMEPSHLSYFLFFTGLFFNNLQLEKKRMFLTIISITLFSTFSSFGFIAGLVIFSLIFHDLRHKRTMIFAIVGIALIAASNFSALVGSVTEIPQLARIIQPESIAVTGRLYAGNDFINELSSTRQLIGVGIGNFNLNGYMSAITYLRTSFGVLGMALLASLIILYLLINRDKTPYVVIIIGMAFFTSMILTPFLLIVLLPFLTGRKHARN